MKKMTWVYRILSILLSGALLMAAGCAQPEPRPRTVTIQDILEMSRAGLPAAEIIDRIRDSGTVYRMDAERVGDLREQGVDDEVIAAMERTFREEKDRRSGSPPPAGPGLWYGGRPSGWPYAR